MKPIVFSLQFRGRARPVGSDRLRLTLSAPSSAVISRVGPDGVTTAFEDVPGAEAKLETELSFDDQAAFDDVGRIEFGRGHVLNFRSVGLGRLWPSPDPNLRHGALVREVEGGAGQFAGAKGLITSNFFISDTGEVTDNDLGLIFVHDAKGGDMHKVRHFVAGSLGALVTCAALFVVTPASADPNPVPGEPGCVGQYTASFAQDWKTFSFEPSGVARLVKFYGGSSPTDWLKSERYADCTA
jgi:hypothetical protein